jgi:hypothetical protein
VIRARRSWDPLEGEIAPKSEKGTRNGERGRSHFGVGINGADVACGTGVR